jgi:anti-anti-sigma factor
MDTTRKPTYKAGSVAFRDTPVEPAAARSRPQVPLPRTRQRHAAALAARSHPMDAPSSWGLRVLTVRDGPRISVTLEGELDLASAAYLRTRLLPTSRPPVGPAPVLVIDASGLGFVDVAGVGALVDIAEAAVRAGGAFQLRRTTPQLDRLIGLLGLDAVLHPAVEGAERREG